MHPKVELKATTYSISLQRMQPGMLEEGLILGKNQEAANNKLHIVRKQHTSWTYIRIFFLSLTLVLFHFNIFFIT
jgi:hypothetical protein